MQDQFTSVCTTTDEIWAHNQDIDKPTALPTDIVEKKISAESLQTPLDLSYEENEPDMEADCIEIITKVDKGFKSTNKHTDVKR